MKAYINPSKQEWNKGKGNYGTEEDRMHELANHIVPLLKHNGFTVYTSPKSMSLGESIKDSNKKLGKGDVHVDLHTNAGGGEGTEVYYSKGSVNGKKLATALYKHIAPETKSSDRGIHGVTHLAAVRDTDATAALVEYMFHDNSEDVAEWISPGEIHRQAENTVKAICEYAGVKYKSRDVKPVTAPNTPTVAPSPAPTPTANKSIATLAQEVIDGKHGSGDARKKSLGSKYDEVQKEVNQLLGVTKRPSKTIDQLAREVIEGQHGYGNTRKKALGTKYSAVQKRVNEILGAKTTRKSISTLAQEVIDGKHGTGRDRMRSLGSNYAAVQREVNRRLR